VTGTPPATNCPASRSEWKSMVSFGPTTIEDPDGCGEYIMKGRGVMSS
jgi:hypothetical protein